MKLAQNRTYIFCDGTDFSKNYSGTERLLIGLETLYTQSKGTLITWVSAWLHGADECVADVVWPSLVHVSQGETDLTAQHAVAANRARAV